jgi:putative NADPH-quinone reductase
MRVLTILANDKKKSLNRFLFDNIVIYLSNNKHNVDTLDLYQRQRDVPFYVQPKSGISITEQNLFDFPFFQEHKERFMAADMLVIITPIYWYSVPGILKSWFDLITNFAWKDQGTLSYPQPLHHITKAVVVATMGMPWWYKVLVTRNVVARQFREIFKFIGIKNYTIYEISNVHKLTEAKAQAHLQKILQKL